MKQNKINPNIFLYILILAFLVFFVAVTCFIHIQSYEDKAAIKLKILINPAEDSKTVNGWYNEKDGRYYFFLPAETTSFEILETESNSFRIVGLEDKQRVSVNDIELNFSYTASINHKKENLKEIDVIFMQSRNIPALFIETDSGKMDYINQKKGNSEKGAISVLSSNPEELFNGKIEKLSGRGNTSWTGCIKKGYKFSLSNPTNLLGLKKSCEWVLIANARSNYLSNYISFWLEKEIGRQNTTDSAFVDLYFNGEYAGNYLLCEKISVGENGINIKDLERVNELTNPGQKANKLEQFINKSETLKAVLWKNEPEDITGGYLLERDVAEYYAEEKSGFILSSGDHYVIKSPQNASIGEAEYIKNYMEEFYQAVSSESGYNNKGKYYTDYIDIDSFALKYVLEEFLAFNDAGRSSAYYFKDANDILKAGPGWDYEGAFLGNSQQITKLNGTAFSTDLYEKLLQHEDFDNLVKKYYSTRLKPSVETLLDDRLTEFQNRINASADMDMIRWTRESFADSCQDIRNWINERVNFLDDQWLSEDKYVTVKVLSEWENNVYIYIQPGGKISEEMLPEYTREGYSFVGWTDANGEIYDFNTPIFENLTLYAMWSSVGHSKIKLLLQYGERLAPEICFGLLFFIVTIMYMIKVRQGGNKK